MKGQFSQHHVAHSCGLVAIGTFFWTCTTFATPVLENIQSGSSVSVQQFSNSTLITQTSQQGIINWQSFNVGAQQSVHFQQPTNGMTLNRISGAQGAAQIYGVLTATGQIILIDRAGIFFGPSAHVDVGGLIATTVNISDSNFMQGNYQFSNHFNSAGSIDNEGQIISAQHGLVALVGSNVSNSGVIKANLGEVVLASGNAFTMSFSDDGLINFVIPAAVKTKTHQNNNSGVSNTGALIANGGEVLVTVQTAQGAMDGSINMQGVVQARSVGKHNGVIILSGDPYGGTVTVGGKLIASGKRHKAKGGTVTITGYNIVLNSSAMINVSGNAGGGQVYIGGDEHGAGPLPNANAILMMPGAVINASAIMNGNGGNIVLWSDNDTRAYGDIIAQGGVESGNGGFVETSSANYLDVNGLSVNLLAPNGQTGNWLLDPANLTICASCTTNSSFASDIYTPNSGNSILLNTDLETELGLASITIETSDVISGAGLGDIDVNAPVIWGNTNTLTLSAFNNVNVSATISATGGGSLVVTTANNVGGTSSGGTLNFTGGNIQFTGVGSSLTINGTSYTLIDSQTELQDVSSTGNYALAENLNASGWTSYAPVGESTAFSGTFNGLGNTISNFTFSNSSLLYVGLFAQIGASGILENLGMTNVNVTGSDSSLSYTAALVASNEGLMQNVYVTGSVTYSGSDIAIDNGLMISYNKGTVTNAYASGTLINDGTQGEAYDGLLVGLNDTEGVITNAYSTGSVIQSGSTAGNANGGLVGYNGGSITNTFSTAAVINNAGTDEIEGGLVGESAGSISYSYATGPVIDNVNSSDYNAGLVASTYMGTISNSYSTGYVGVNSNDDNGGLVAYSDGTAISDSFWDQATSGQATSAGGTNLTTAQAMSVSYLSSVGSLSGFVSSPWGILDGQSYPYLLAFYPGTPQVISGTSAAATGTSAAVNLAVNGTVTDTTQTGSNGFYYFLLGNNAVSNINTMVGGAATDALVYLDSGAIYQNAVTSIPTLGASYSGATSALNLGSVANTVTLGGNLTATLSVTDLIAAVGNLSGTYILYSASSSGVTPSTNVNFTTTTATTFNVPAFIVLGGTGALTFNGPTSLSVLTTIEADAINIGNVLSGNGNDVNVTATGAIQEFGSGAVNDASLFLSSVGGVTLDGANTISFISEGNTGGGAISLMNTASTLTVAGISQSGTGAITIDNTGAMNLTETIDAGSANDVYLTATGAISQGVASAITGATLTTSSAGGAALIGDGYNAVTSFNATNTTSGDVDLTNTTTTLSVTGINQTGGGNINVNNTGAISTSGAISTDTGDVLLGATGATITIGNSVAAGGAGTVTLTATGATSDVLFNANVSSTSGMISVSAGRDITLNAGNISTSGPVNLDADQVAPAGGYVDEASTGYINGGLLTTTFSGDETLDAANTVTGFNATDYSSGTINLINTATSLNITGVSARGTSSFTVNNTGAISVTGSLAEGDGNDVTLTASGTLAESGTGYIDANLLTVTSAGGETLTGANTVTSIDVTNTSGGAVMFTDTYPMTITAVSQSGSGAVTFTGSDTSIDVTGSLSAGSGNNIFLTAGTAIMEGASGLISGAVLTTSSATGTGLDEANTVTGFNASNSGIGSIYLMNSAAPLTITGISQTGSGSISVNNTGGVLITGTITTDSNSVAITASSTISESGSGLVSTSTNVPFSATSVGGEAFGGANTITKFDATNTGGGAIGLTNTASTLTITSVSQTGTGDITIGNTGAISVTGDLAGGSANTVSLTASTTLGEGVSGLVSGAALTTSSAGGETLNGANVVASFNATNTGGGAIGFTNTASTLSISGISQTGTGGVTINNTGAISVTGDLAGGSANTVSLTASTTLGEGASGLVSGADLTTSSAGGETLNGANAVATFNATNTGGGAIGFTNTASTLSISGISQTGTGGVTINNTGAISVTGDLAGGSANTVSLTASTTLGEGASGLVSGADLTTSSAGGETLNGANAVASFNATNTGGGAIGFTNTASTLSISGISQTGTGGVTINNTGAISVTGDLAGGSANTVSLTASTTLGEGASGLVSGADLTTSSAGGETLNGANAVASFNATNTGGGAVGFTNTASTLSISGISQTGTGDITINNTGAISVTGSLAGGSANTVSLTASTTVGEGASGLVSGADLTTSSVGGETLNGANAVASFSATNTDGGTITLMNTASLLTITNLSQTSGDTIAITNTGAISVGSITGNYLLTLSSSTGTTLDGTINIGSLTINGGASDTVGAASVTTTGDQNYNDALIMEHDASFTLSGSANINIDQGISGDHILTLNGAPGATDNFVLSGSLTLNQININGGSGGNNTINISSGNSQAFSINGVNTGSINGTGTTNPIQFNNIQNLIGGNNNNSFMLINGGSINGVINGGSGNNTIDYTNYAAAATVNLANQTASGMLSYSNINNFIGNITNTNTLIGANVNNTWNISGVNTGSVGSANFSNFQNLNGGNQGNDFVFTNSATVSGTINGGNLNYMNILDYSAYSSVVTVTLANGIYSGSTQNIVNKFTNINNLIGNNANANVLSLQNQTNTVTVTGAYTGYVNDPFYFNGFKVMTAGAGDNNQAYITAPSSVDTINGDVEVDGESMSFSNFIFPGIPQTASNAVSQQTLQSIPSIVQQGNVSSSTCTNCINILSTDIEVQSWYDDMLHDGYPDYDVDNQSDDFSFYCGA